MKCYKYTKERLTPVVKTSSSWAEVCRKFGISDRSGVQGHIKKVAVAHGIDFSHFKGYAWNKGRSFDKKPISFYLVKDSKILSTKLRLKLISEGLKEHRCEKCLNVEWNNNLIPLELDHINGDHKDNRIENLQILCPNCHAQTETYCRAKSSRIKDPVRLCICGNKKDKNAKKCLSCFKDEFKEVSKKVLCKCGESKAKSSTQCKKCDTLRRKKITKIAYPSLLELQERIKRSSYVQVGKELGVSDNAVRKRVKSLMTQ